MAPSGNMAGQMGGAHPGGGGFSGSPHPSTAVPGGGRPAPAPVQSAPPAGAPRRATPTLIPRKK
jgi:hypothetical protein